MNNPIHKKIRLSQLTETKRVLRRCNLHSVCEEGMCPNISECFSRKTATFLILGDVCTRNCTFCSVKKGMPRSVDMEEPARIAEAVKILDMDHVVITSVTRDDLPDGGAEIFRRTVEEIKKLSGSKKAEVLIPDFRGSKDSLRILLSASPDVCVHNVETVPTLYPQLRAMADYERSLGILKAAKNMNPEQPTKSGLMLGLGEKEDEVLDVIKDLAAAGCDFLSIGQYLAPSKTSYPVKRMVSPAEFNRYRKRAEELGFTHAESATYVRTSYRASFYLSSMKKHVER